MKNVKTFIGKKEVLQLLRKNKNEYWFRKTCSKCFLKYQEISCYAKSQIISFVFSKSGDIKACSYVNSKNKSKPLMEDQAICKNMKNMKTFIDKKYGLQLLGKNKNEYWFCKLVVPFEIEQSSYLN